MYLCEALKHDVPALHEDRLTQIISATFNESSEFRRLFLRFLEIPYKTHLRTKTQVGTIGALSRPDLIIQHRDSAYAVIESKVRAKSCRIQQDLHSKTYAKYYFLICRDAVRPGALGRRFKKLTWYELFSFLKSNISNERTIGSFLVHQLINYGEQCGMLLPDSILKSDFENACTFLTELRLRDNPFHSFDKTSPAHSLDRISRFLEHILIRVKDDLLLGPQLTSFSKRIRTATVVDIDLDTEIGKIKNKSLRRDLLFKSTTVALEKEIRLKKALKGYHHLYVRVTFTPHLRNTDLSEASIKDLQKIRFKDLRYKCQVIAGLSDSGRVFHFDRSIISDGNRDLEFNIFYLSAVKHWKRRLGLRSGQKKR